MVGEGDLASEGRLAVRGFRRTEGFTEVSACSIERVGLDLAD
jgi:hypothetical protein